MEMFGKIVMYVGLALLAGLVPALAAVWLRERGLSPLKRLYGEFRRLPLPIRLIALGFVAHLVVFAGAKHQPPARRVADPDADSAETRGGFTEEELAAGVVQTWVRTDEAWRFDLAPGATVVEPWRLRGAADDWSAFATTNLSGFVFAGGRIQDRVRDPRVVYAPLWTTLGVAPEANWPLVGGSGAASRVWYGESDGGTVSVTWEDALLGRAAERPVSLQAVFDESGRFVYRYGMANGKWKVENGEWDAGLVTNAFAGVVNNGRTLSVPMGTNVTSVGWYRIQPEDAANADRDGDGLSTREEVFLHDTDPGRPDTDCDGVNDGDEIARGLDPLDADSDHDGLVDGSDPDPLAATSLEDLDGDGIPDAYERHWFGGTNTCDGAEARDGTGFTLGTKLLAGMNPTNAPGVRVDVATNELACWRLWDGFAARWPAGGTNLVYERTVEIGRSNPLQQFFLSSESGAAGAWRLAGMELEVAWGDDPGNRATATASPHGDSWRIPFGTEDVSTVTFRLRATGPVVGCATPVYLIAYAPELRVSGGQRLELGDGSTVYVFTEGAESRIEVALDRTRRPCRAPLSSDERDVSGLGGAATYGMDGFRYEGTATGGLMRAEGTGVYAFPSFGVGGAARAARAAGRSRAPAAPEPGARVMVLQPHVGWSGDDQGPWCGDDLDWDGEWYRYGSSYPLDSKCLAEGWRRDAHGGWTCTCTPTVSSGLDDDPLVTTEVGGGLDTGTATGSVLVDGHRVWSGSSEHVWDPGWECGDDLAEGARAGRAGTARAGTATPWRVRRSRPSSSGFRSASRAEGRSRASRTSTRRSRCTSRRRRSGTWCGATRT